MKLALPVRIVIVTLIVLFVPFATRSVATFAQTKTRRPLPRNWCLRRREPARLRAQLFWAGYGVAGPHTQASLGNWDLRPGLAAVAAPTLVLHGEAEAIPMDLVEEWPRALSHAKLVKIPGASHFPYVERPDLVWPAIEDFLHSTQP